jgi:CRP-like cAMP-binding protein
MSQRPDSPPAAEILAIVAAMPLLRELDPPQLARIAQTAQFVVRRRNENIFARGDPCLGFHQLLSGQVKLSFTSDRGGEKVIEVVGPGQTFGEAVMFLDKPYIVSAVALNESRLLFVAKVSILREIESDPRIIRRILGSLSQRLHHLVDDIGNLSLHSARERVLGFLLSCTEKTPPGEAVRLPFGKALLASRLNITQEHFSRILHQLREEGIIAVDRGTIRFLDTCER